MEVLFDARLVWRLAMVVFMTFSTVTNSTNGVNRDCMLQNVLYFLSVYFWFGGQPT